VTSIEYEIELERANGKADRRFNETFQRLYARPPASLRRRSGPLRKLLLFFLKEGSLSFGFGIFLPSFILVLVAAPLLAKYRGNPNVQGFAKGAYAAAIGTILGACILLGRIAIGDWLTALVGVLSLAILFRWKVNNPLLIAATAVIGLVPYPLLQPTWVMLK
jgi:Chromate transporter